VEQVQEKVAVHSAEIDHMKKDIDHIMNKVDKMDKSIDDIKSTLDEFRGGKRMAMWLFSAFAAVIAFFVGHCNLRNAIRVFHIDRITGLEPNRFKPKTPDFNFPVDFKLRDYVVKYPWQMQVHDPVEAVIRIEPPAAKTAVTELAESSIKIEDDGEARILHLQATFLNGLLSTILWYRNKAIALFPPELVQKTKSALERMVLVDR